MRRCLSVIAVTALFVWGFPVGLAGADRSPGQDVQAGVVPRGFAHPSWYYWSMSDIQLTDNPAEDGTPVPAVDQKGDCGIAWNRAGSLMWMKIDRNGLFLNAEKNLLQGGFPKQETGFVSPCIAADSSGDFHVVARPGGTGAGYAKFDGSGGQLVPWKAVSLCASNPDNPSIALAPGGNISITWEDSWGGFSEKALACTLLDVNGTMVKDGVQMSQAGWDCKGSTVTADNAGNVHATMLNLSRGVYHVMLDKQGNQILQAPPTFLYTAGSVATDGPPGIACDGSGAVHLVWNDKPQGTGTVKYMKLDNHGNKLAAGPDGMGINLTYGATCRGFPAIVADTDGNAYPFWSDIRNGSPQIFFIEMMHDFVDVNASNLWEWADPLTKETGGSAWEPRAALDRVGNLFVVWKDNRNGNPEIYFKYGFNPGVNLKTESSEMRRLLEIHPNHVRSANMTLLNTGGGPDTAELGLKVDFLGRPGGTGTNYSGNGWKVWFSPPGPTVDIGYLETKNVMLNIRGPATGVENDYICVTINSSSQMNPVVKSGESFKAYLVMNHSLDRLSFGDHVRTTDAGVETFFTLSIANGGLMDEGFDLSADGPPGWNWKLVAEHVHLNGKEVNTLMLAVKPPMDAAGDEVGTVTVTARFAEEPTKFGTANTHTIVRPVTKLQIWPDRENGTVAPGETTSYVITVEQTGNVRKPAPIMIEVSGRREGWNFSLDSTAVSLASGESERVVLMVSAPAGALFGDELAVNISCSNLEGTVTAECAVTTSVGQVHGFHLAAEPSSAAIYPGASALFDIDVTNTGNGPERFWPDDIPGPAGWSVTLMGARPGVDVRKEGISVEAGGTGWFEAAVASPSNASMGEHRFVGRVRDGSGSARFVEFTVRVSQVFGLEIGSTNNDQAAETGARVIFPVSLRNTGNGPDSIRLSAPALPAGWAPAEFRDGQNVVADRLVVSASSVGQMRMVVVVPASTGVDELNFNVTAFSAGGQNVTIGLYLKILKADLVITGVEVISTLLKVGKPVFVRVTVRNEGGAPAANVTVSYWRNGVLRTSESLGAVARDGNATATFIWVPVEGKNELRFAVDPKNVVCERNEANNGASYQKRLYTEKVAVFQDNTWMAIALVIPAIGAGFFLGIRALRKGNRASR